MELAKSSIMTIHYMKLKNNSRRLFAKAVLHGALEFTVQFMLTVACDQLLPYPPNNWDDRLVP